MLTFMAAVRRTEKMNLAAAFQTASAHGPLEDLEADEAPVPFPRSGMCDDDQGGGSTSLKTSAMEGTYGIEVYVGEQHRETRGERLNRTRISPGVRWRSQSRSGMTGEHEFVMDAQGRRVRRCGRTRDCGASPVDCFVEDDLVSEAELLDA